MSILNFLIEQESGGPIINVIENGNFSSWNSMSAYTLNKNDTHSRGMSFDMFSPAPEPSSSTKREIFDSSVMRCTIQHLKDIKMRPKGDDSVLVSTEAMHIFTISNSIGGSVLLPVLYENVLLAECAKVNMLGWNNFPIKQGWWLP